MATRGRPKAPAPPTPKRHIGVTLDDDTQQKLDELVAHFHVQAFGPGTHDIIKPGRIIVAAIQRLHETELGNGAKPTRRKRA